MHFFQTVDVFLGFLACAFRHFHFFQFFQITVDLVDVLGLFTQFFFDGLQLLAQEILLLILVHFALGFEVDLILHVQHFDFIIQIFVDVAKSFERILFFQDSLGFLDLQFQVGGNDIGQFARFLNVFGYDQDLVGYLFSQLADLFEFFAYILDHGFVFQRQFGRLFVFHLHDLGLQNFPSVDKGPYLDPRTHPG